MLGEWDFSFKAPYLCSEQRHVIAVLFNESERKEKNLSMQRNSMFSLERNS